MTATVSNCLNENPQASLFVHYEIRLRFVSSLLILCETVCLFCALYTNTSLISLYYRARFTVFDLAGYVLMMECNIQC